MNITLPPAAIYRYLMTNCHYFIQGDVNNLERQLSTTTIAQKDVTIQKLKNKLLQHEQMEKELTEENNNQHDVIMALKQEINILENTISMRIIELDNKTQSIQILERQLLEMKEKVKK